MSEIGERGHVESGRGGRQRIRGRGRERRRRGKGGKRVGHEGGGGEEVEEDR